MGIPVEKMMKIIEENNTDNHFGYLPLMCKNSKCQLGALSAQSFAERMNSVGNQIVTKDRTLLKDDQLEKLVVLRMNHDFLVATAKEKSKSIWNMNYVQFDV
jgi:hypothetical protein